MRHRPLGADVTRPTRDQILVAESVLLWTGDLSVQGVRRRASLNAPGTKSPPRGPDLPAVARVSSWSASGSSPPSRLGRTDRSRRVFAKHCEARRDPARRCQGAGMPLAWRHCVYSRYAEPTGALFARVLRQPNGLWTSVTASSGQKPGSAARTCTRCALESPESAQEPVPADPRRSAGIRSAGLGRPGRASRWDHLRVPDETHGTVNRPCGRAPSEADRPR
jgi:hypothetical protein